MISLGAAMLGGSAISAAGSLLGGAIGSKTSNWPNFWADKNFRFQKNYARNGITWRVNDAKQAGIHPLAALGAASPGFSPVSGSGEFPNLAMGDAVQNMGQDIGRAVRGMANAEERELGLKLAREQVKQAEIETAMAQYQLNNQITGGNSQPNPPHPYVGPWANPLSESLGTTDHSRMSVIQPERLSSPSPKKLDQESGSHPSVKWQNQGDGLYPVMSNSYKQSSEDSFIQEAPWYYENFIKPITGTGGPKPTMQEVKTNWPSATGFYKDGVKIKPLFNNEKPPRGWFQAIQRLKLNAKYYWQKFDEAQKTYHGPFRRSKTYGGSGSW